MARLFVPQGGVPLLADAVQRFYTAIRPLDACACLNRMRGLRFTKIP